jgi:hypothetical protein
VNKIEQLTSNRSPWVCTAQSLMVLSSRSVSFSLVSFLPPGRS